MYSIYRSKINTDMFFACCIPEYEKLQYAFNSEKKI